MLNFNSIYDIKKDPKRGKKQTGMDKTKKNFGFGMMRLPMNGEEVDIEETKKMVDAFLEAGFNYFDTAHGYFQGKNETAIKECLTDRYPRGSYVLTDKLTGSFFKKEEDIRPFLKASLPPAALIILIFTLCTLRIRKNKNSTSEIFVFEVLSFLWSPLIFFHVNAAVRFESNALTFKEKTLFRPAGSRAP